MYSFRSFLEKFIFSFPRICLKTALPRQRKEYKVIFDCESLMKDSKIGEKEGNVSFQHAAFSSLFSREGTFDKSHRA